MFINENPVGWELQGGGAGWSGLFLLCLIAGFTTEAERGGRLSSSHLGKSGSARPGGGGKGKVNQEVFKNLPAGSRGGWRF